MEPEVAAFLRRISFSIGIAFLWLAITSIAAVKGDNAFIHEHLSWANILFYSWLVISLVCIFFIYKKLWRRQ